MNRRHRDSVSGELAGVSAAERPASASLASDRTWLAAFLVDFSPVDWLLVVYFVLLFVGVLFGAGPDRMLAGRIVLENLVVLAIGLALTRGAQKDIFPSLHTAVPTMFTLLAFRFRREFRPFRWSWPVMAFCTSQIIVATMYVRWHYLIDICAEVTLAAVAVTLTDRAVRWDDARRERLGLVPAWTLLTLEPYAVTDGKV
jgi:hypothetical protein